jgi:hypothetical protein
VSDYKGTGVVFVRRALAAAGPDATQAVSEGLDEAERALFERTVATDWVPIEFITKLFELAAVALYPGKVGAIRLVGRDLAYDNLSGVYRYIVRVLTIPFVMDQSAKLWHTYHRHGRSEVVRLTSHSVTFVVHDYPRLPERFRECMCGYIAGTLELCGGRDVAVAKYDADPNAWEFRMVWK